MKKLCAYLIIFSLFSLSVFCSFSCSNKKVNPLYERVSELRTHLFEGKNENFSLSACYGFKETPYENDGAVKKKVYALTFKLWEKERDGATYALSIDIDGEVYKTNFKFNPVTHNLTAQIEVENFSKKEFNVSILSGGAPEVIYLKSIVPEKTIDYKKALDFLYNDQQNLINAFCDENGNFNAEIYARIVVKNDKPFWYIGLASGSGNLKALLIDGFSGKTLAIREIF